MAERRHKYWWFTWRMKISVTPVLAFDCGGDKFEWEKAWTWKDRWQCSVCRKNGEATKNFLRDERRSQIVSRDFPKSRVQICSSEGNWVEWGWYWYWTVRFMDCLEKELGVDCMRTIGSTLRTSETFGSFQWMRGKENTLYDQLSWLFDK